jgi:hypothetical protein
MRRKKKVSSASARDAKQSSKGTTWDTAKRGNMNLFFFFL